MSRESILAGLEPLFKEAEEKGFWFRSNYQNSEFSPQELRAEHAKGSFIWGAVNWQLFDPEIELDKLTIRIESATRNATSKRDRFAVRLEESKKG